MSPCCTQQCGWVGIVPSALSLAATGFLILRLRGSPLAPCFRPPVPLPPPPGPPPRSQALEKLLPVVAAQDGGGGGRTVAVEFGTGDGSPVVSALLKTKWELREGGGHLGRLGRQAAAQQGADRHTAQAAHVIIFIQHWQYWHAVLAAAHMMICKELGACQLRRRMLCPHHPPTRHPATMPPGDLPRHAAPQPPSPRPPQHHNVPKP